MFLRLCSEYQFRGPAERCKGAHSSRLRMSKGLVVGARRFTLAKLSRKLMGILDVPGILGLAVLRVVGAGNGCEFTAAGGDG